MVMNKQRCSWLVACGFALTQLSVGCGQDAASANTPADTASTADAETSDTDVVSVYGKPPICLLPAGWDGKSVGLSDARTETGLAALQVVGIRLSVTDLDGDDYPDLYARGMANQGKREPFGSPGRQMFLLRNDFKASGKWQDVTESSGLLRTRDDNNGRQGQIGVFGDVDNDGDLDAFVGLWAPASKDGFAQDHSEVLLNDGKGQFALTPTADFGKAALRGGLTAASFVDYDRDGKLDLWLGYNDFNGKSNPDRLFHGSGDGQFSDTTVSEGLMTKPYGKLSDIRAGLADHPTWGTAACDLDNNGDPELLSVSYGRYFNAAWFPGFLAGDKRYSNQAFATHLHQDDNNDWCSNWNAQCHCADNPTAEGCDTCGPPEVNCVALKAAFGGQYRWSHQYDREAWRLGGNTGTVLCADLDADGDLDLVESTIVHPDVGPTSDPTRIIRNDGGNLPLFSHLSVEQTGFGHTWPDGNADDTGDISAAVLDFDNDGRLDIVVAGGEYPGTRAKLFHQQPDGRFVDVTQAIGLDHPHASAVAVADFDRDGDVDIVLGHSRSRCSLSPKECWATEEVHLWRNDIGNQRNWLQLKLVGQDGSNRSAIGARVTVKTADRTQTFEVGGGNGHFGLQNDLVLHVGLGDACTAEVTVRWPDSALTTQTWTLGAGHLTVLGM